MNEQERPQVTIDRMMRVEDKVDIIMGNHLVHLDAKIDKVDAKVDKIIWLILSTLITLVLTYIFK